jgi:HD-like signal output (HDOD) protein
MIEQNKSLEEKVADLVNRIPPMPEHIDALLNAGFEKNNDKLISLIKNDPAICTELLHLANSHQCYSAEGQKIDTIEEAIKCIGAGPLVMMMGVAFAQDTIQEHYSHMNRIYDYFDHSRTISKACTVMSKAAGMGNDETSSYAVAGLIHDIGRLIILLASEKDSIPLMGTSWREMEKVLENEREAFKMDHCQVGERICEKWNFTGLLQEGVLRHHSPIVNSDFSRIGGVIFVAHFLSANDFTGQIVEKWLPKRLIEGIGLDHEKWKTARELYVANK